jgi:hypothetical protein
LTGRLLFDDRAVFGCGVLHYVELRCQRRCGKCRKAAAATSNFIRMNSSFIALSTNRLPTRWFHLIADLIFASARFGKSNSRFERFTSNGDSKKQLAGSNV